MSVRYYIKRKPFKLDEFTNPDTNIPPSVEHETVMQRLCVCGICDRRWWADAGTRTNCPRHTRYGFEVTV